MTTGTRTAGERITWDGGQAAEPLLDELVPELDVLPEELLPEDEPLPELDPLTAVDPLPEDELLTEVEPPPDDEPLTEVDPPPDDDPLTELELAEAAAPPLPVEAELDGVPLDPLLEEVAWLDPQAASRKVALALRTAEEIARNRIFASTWEGGRMAFADRRARPQGLPRIVRGPSGSVRTNPRIFAAAHRGKPPFPVGGAPNLASPDYS